MPDKANSISIKISGPAGSGIVKLGEILSHAFNLEGFFTLAYSEYPSRIRGGDNSIQIAIGNQPNPLLSRKVDLLLAFSSELLKAHQGEVKKSGGVFLAQEIGLTELAVVKKNPIVLNSAAAGFIWGLFFGNLGSLESEIKESVKPSYLAANLEAVKAGFDLRKKNKLILPEATKDKITSSTGNELFASGAATAGCEFISIYPMTPITSFLAAMSKLKIKQIMPEDEIYAVLSTLGASYAGARALTATSGGGFCLMSEAIGFSAMAEIPLVILLGQRTGPSSGIPTFTSQADLDFAIHASHGEFPRIVLAPGDPMEIYRLIQEAFNLAECYQVPTIVLTDKYLSESQASYREDELNKIKVKVDRGKRYRKSNGVYQRYEDTSDGVSPRAYPGEVTFSTNSYEHDEAGFSSDEAAVRERMMRKRSRKLFALSGGFECFGNPKSKKFILGWGSTKGSILPFINRRDDLQFIHVFRLWPFPAALKSLLKPAEKVVVVEGNNFGQLAKIIEGETVKKVQRFLKDDGRPFFEEDLEQLFKKI